MKNNHRANPHIVIVTGLSGSGKSTAIKAFEDIEYLCIDNLPVPLLPAFLELCEKKMPDTGKIALGIDIRERTFLNEYDTIFDDIQKKGYLLEILFFEASVDVLQRRYSHTRRLHPLEFLGNNEEGEESSGSLRYNKGTHRSLASAIKKEMELLKPLRDRATRVIDTSEISVHVLKQFIIETYSLVKEKELLTIQVLSFGYKYGIPFDADIIMDVRFLPNPHFIETLRSLTGCDARVQNWVMSQDDSTIFIRHMESFLAFLIPRYIQEGKRYLTLAFGCTGGKHRSVAMVEHFALWLKGQGFYTITFHRDIGHE